MHALSFSFKACALSFREVALAEVIERSIHGRADVSLALDCRSERQIQGQHTGADRPEAREPA